MVFEGVHTGMSLDLRAATNAIYGIRPNKGYSSFSGPRDMASAEKSVDGEMSKEQDEDISKYLSFKEIREGGFLPF